MGLSSIQSYSLLEPMQNVVTALSFMKPFFLLVKTPISYRSIIESTNISVCTPKSRLSLSDRATALGIPPMPSCMVDPSSTSSAMCEPISMSTSPG